MRILIASDSFLPTRSGIVRSICNLATGLGNIGDEVRVVAPIFGTLDSREDYPQNVQVYSIEGRSIPFISPRPIVRAADARCAVEEIVHDWQPDIIHVYTPFSLGKAALNAAKRSSIPSVVGIHLLPSNATAHSVVGRLAPPLAKRYLFNAYSGCMELADIVAVPTKSALPYARRIAVNKDVLVVSNGTPQFKSAASYLSCIGGDRARLLYVGRLSREKNVATLLRAFPLVNATVPSTLKVIGDGPDRARLQRIVKHLKIENVDFLGTVSDDCLAASYKSADIFCMPSPSELECVAALEALSYGLPIIAPRRGALAELAGWSEAFSLYDSPNSSHDLAMCVIGVLTDNDYIARLRTSALSAAMARQTSTTAEQWRKIYSEMSNTQRDAPSRRTSSHPSASEDASGSFSRANAIWCETPHGKLRLFYERGAAGAPTLVLLHGIVVDSIACWAGVVDELRGDFNVLAIDCYGHGSLLHKGERLTLEVFADDVLFALHKLSIRKAAFVGQSLGGAVAQILARQAIHDRLSPVGACVFSSTTNRFKTSTKDRIYFIWLNLARWFMHCLPAPPRRFVGSLFAKLRGLDNYRHFDDRDFDWATVLDAAHCIGGFDSTRWVREIRTPTAAIITLRGDVVSVEKQRDLARLLRCPEFSLDVSHDGCMTNPKEYVEILRISLERII